MPWSKEFGAVLTRLEGDIGPRELGRQLDVSHTYLSALFEGRVPSRRMVLRIADGLEATEAQRAELLLAAGYLPSNDYVLGQRALRWILATQELTERYQADVKGDEIRHVDLGSDEGVERCLKALHDRLAQDGPCSQPP